jgi:hypothetical protein
MPLTAAQAKAKADIKKLDIAGVHSRIEAHADAGYSDVSIRFAELKSTQNPDALLADLQGHGYTVTADANNISIRW